MFGPWLSCPMVSWFQRPCPTCGVRRALALFTHGHIAASLALQPLALPLLLSGWLLATEAIRGTLVGGAPFDLLSQTRGRLVLASAALSFVLSVVLWALRASGYFGGAVAI